MVINQTLERFAYRTGAKAPADVQAPAGVDSEMFSFLKKIWRDRRGNALVIAGAALPLIVGSAGLATDTIEWSLWKRQLQRAADSAALAGMYAELQGKALDNCSTFSSATYAKPIGYDVRKNDDSGITTSCTASNPPKTGSYTGDSRAVQVTLTGSRALSFSGMFMSSPPTITASATATLVDTGKFCLVTLNNTSTPGITMGGNSSATFGCGAISNSTGSSSITSNGNSYSFTADPVASVGGMPTSITGSTDLEPYHTPEPDPFAGKYSTSIPAGTNCKTFNQNTYTTTTGTGQNKVTVNHLYSYETKPGGGGTCYSDFSPSGNGTYYMDAGTYYLYNTDFNPGGTVTLIGTNVTIILTGTAPGAVTLSGNQTIQLSANPTGAYAKMLFIQAPGAASGSTINGTSSSSFDGGMYFPSTNVTFNGTSGAMTKCAMVVSWTATFSGTTNLQNDTTGCKDNFTVTAKKIALVE